MDDDAGEVNSAAGRGQGQQQLLLLHPRACMTCSRAKVKCVYLNSDGRGRSHDEDEDGKTCQRCRRLQKTCEPMPVRLRAKRKPRVNGERKNRVEKLEQRLDGLVALLVESQKAGLGSGNGAGIGNGIVVGPFTPSISPDRAAAVEPTNFIRSGVGYGLKKGSNGASSQGSEMLSAAPSNASDRLLPLRPQAYSLPVSATQTGLSHTEPTLAQELSPQPSCYHTVQSSITGDEDPNYLLAVFREQNYPWLPFVSIDPRLTAEGLQKERPFLYLAIMAAVTKNSERKLSLQKVVVSELAERVFVRNERSLDVLMGVMVYTGWTLTHFFHIPGFTSLLSAATMVVADLRINRDPLSETLPSFVQAFKASCGIPVFSSTLRTLEERKAYLGYFLLASVIALLFRRLDPPPWNQYVDECCQLLNETDDLEDKEAVGMLQLQGIVMKVPQSLWHTNPEPVSPFGEAFKSLTSLITQLQDIKKRLHPKISCRATIQLGYYHAEIAIYRVGLSKLSANSTFDELGPQRLSLLYSCLESVKNWLDVFLSISDTAYGSLSVITLAQLTQTTGALYLLSVFQYPGWSLSIVNERVNLQDFLAQMTERSLQVKSALGLDPHTTERLDEHSKAADKYQLLRAWFADKTVPSLQQLPPDQSNAQLTANQQDTGADITGYPMDYLDDAWLREMFESWDYGSTMEL